MRLLIASLVVVGAVALSACGGDGGNKNDVDGGTTNELACSTDHATVTAERLFTDLVGGPGQCNTCHYTNAPVGTGGGVVMDSAATLKANVGKDSAYGGGLKVVDPNHPENSTMYLKCSGGSPKVKGPRGQSVGAQMPQGLPSLSAEQLKEIKDWICSGAQ